MVKKIIGFPPGTTTTSSLVTFTPRERLTSSAMACLNSEAQPRGVVGPTAQGPDSGLYDIGRSVEIGFADECPPCRSRLLSRTSTPGATCARPVEVHVVWFDSWGPRSASLYSPGFGAPAKGIPLCTAYGKPEGCHSASPGSEMPKGTHRLGPKTCPPLRYTCATALPQPKVLPSAVSGVTALCRSPCSRRARPRGAAR